MLVYQRVDLNQQKHEQFLHAINRSSQVPRGAEEVSACLSNKIFTEILDSKVYSINNTPGFLSKSARKYRKKIQAFF